MTNRTHPRMNTAKSMALAGALLFPGAALAQQTLPAQPQQPAQRPPQAQPQQPPQAQPQQPAPAPRAVPEIPGEQLEKAVVAYVAVNEIQTRVQEQLAGVEDQERIQETVMQARADMVQAVQEAGLEPAEYEQVMNAVTQHEQIRTAFLQRLQQHQTGG